FRRHAAYGCDHHLRRARAVARPARGGAIARCLAGRTAAYRRGDSHGESASRAGGGARHSRRRATQSPTQQLFASLIGLEVSPRTIRECIAFWRQISAKVSAEDRERLWEEAYALPIPAEISDPEGFLKGRSAPDDLSSL
ncbi:MAG: hypothetical protein EBY74_02250, partial [Actinobacteria bacterium]|nr:hypothetical protein [Actinomycetota bacterium]